jgi:alkylhydroperoxidase family enzyme
MTWLPSISSDRCSFDDVFALRGDLHEAYRQFYALFWDQRLVDPVLLEVVRLRIAALNGCNAETRLRYRPALDAGLDEERACEAIAGAAPPATSRLDLLERACLVLAEKFVLDVHAISDDDVAAVRDAIGEAPLVALIEAMALFDGFTRFRLILGVTASDDAPVIVDAPGVPESAS